MDINHYNTRTFEIIINAQTFQKRILHGYLQLLNMDISINRKINMMKKENCFLRGKKIVLR